jgi:hypothetical protein
MVRTTEGEGEQVCCHAARLGRGFGLVAGSCGSHLSCSVIFGVECVPKWGARGLGGSDCLRCSFESSPTFLLERVLPPSALLLFRGD